MRMGPSGYRGIGSTIAGEEFTAFRTAEPTANPACSLGWYQVRRTDDVYFDDQNQSYGPMSLPDAWVCRGDGGETWVEPIQASQTLSVDLIPNPSSGTAPLNLNLTALVAGTATGTINYSFWWNCNDTGSSVESVKLVCGDPNDPAFGAKFDAVNDNPKVVSHTYSAAGDYTAKVIVERGAAAPFERRASVTVTSPPPTPTPTPTTNPYVRIDQIYKLSDGETTYINVKWTLLQKWNQAAVAVYPSLNGNLPGTTLSCCFVPEQMGGSCFYYNDFISLGRSLDNGFYMWKPIGTGGCSAGGPGPDDYEVGQQYTTRFSRVFDMSTFRWVNGKDITDASDLRFTVYDKTQFDGSPCNMDDRVAYPDETDFHVQPTGTADLATTTSVSPNPIVSSDDFTYTVTLKTTGRTRPFR